VLKFDRPLDFSRGDVGRLEGGQLDGPRVVIRSDCKHPGPDDDLLINIHGDIKLVGQTAVAACPVDFRLGPHYGNGRDMELKLLSGPPMPGMERSGPNIKGIESFELRHIEQLHLDGGQMMARPDSKPDSVPVDIHCRGPFRFDKSNNVATFSDAVDVTMKRTPSGQSDRILCDLLSLYFVERQGSGGSPPGQNTSNPPQTGSLDLTPQRLEARGKPAVLDAPSERIVSRAERFLYDLAAKSILLDGGQEVYFQQGPNEIHARTLFYQSAGEDHIGRLEAQGPGRLQGQSPEKPDYKLEAEWRDQLRIEPNNQKQRISLTGGALLNFPGFGQLQAQEIFFWFQELPPPAKGKMPAMQPDLLWARNNVHINAKQLSSKVDDLQVKFETANQGTGMVGSPTLQPTIQSLQSVTASPTNPFHRFHVEGKKLSASVLLNGQDVSMSNLTVEQNVQLLEMPMAQPIQQPVLVRGDRLEARDLSANSAEVTILGSPARFEGQGMVLTSSNIHVAPQKNSLVIDGPGQMELPAPMGLAGQVSASPVPMTIDWRRRMDFDGQTAHFEESVIASARQVPLEKGSGTMDFQLDTQSMYVTLQQMIQFMNPITQGRHDVETIRCRSGVKIESRTFDPEKQLQSHNLLTISDLAVNGLNDTLNGAALTGGAGNLNSVFLITAEMPGNKPSPTGPAPLQKTLQCLNVVFKKSLTGKLLTTRQLSFSDQVRMTYGPVDNWNAVLDTDNPDRLGTGGSVAHCDQLNVAQMRAPTGSRQAFELDAVGNVKVEGKTFEGKTYMARGYRITYDESKDLMTFQGDGRSDAELFEVPQPGVAPKRTAFKAFRYWPNTSKQIEIIGPRFLDITLPPGTNRLK
jgi:lipopolysaccharide export system protein LptA